MLETKFFRSKHLLQLAVAIGGMVPVCAGFAGILFGPAFVDGGTATPIALDSHFRYLSGLLLALGLGFWATIPDIERKSAYFRLLAAIVVGGGLGRLWSLFMVGVPDRPMLFGLAMELAVTPLLALWQFRVARSRS